MIRPGPLKTLGNYARPWKTFHGPQHKAGVPCRCVGENCLHLNCQKQSSTVSHRSFWSFLVAYFDGDAIKLYSYTVFILLVNAQVMGVSWKMGARFWFSDSVNAKAHHWVSGAAWSELECISYELNRRFNCPNVWQGLGAIGKQIHAAEGYCYEDTSEKSVLTAAAG